MTLNIGGRLVGPGQPTWIIAELGVNHNGNAALARQMVREAALAGADAVKVQHFHTDCFVSKHATYNGESQRHMFNRYQLSEAAIGAVAEECAHEGVTFFGTPDCEEAARLLLDCGAPALKVGSDDLTNLPLIRSFAGMGVPLILSTGMADWIEILAVARAIENSGPDDYAVLHCVSLYPTPYHLANLRKIAVLLDDFTSVGFSDHTDGTEAAVTAVAMGAQIIEKHFTLDRSLPGPDHAFSASPAQFAEMVAAIRRTEKLLGSGDIEPSDDEKAMRLVARRSIRSRFDCPAGTLLTRGHLVFQRPGDGLSPARLDDVLGKSLRVAKTAGDNVLAEDVR